MSNSCQVSILVPVCNVERYLRECLSSLLSQTLENIQIICIDDGSTDSSPQILEEFRKRDHRIEVITKPNSGYGDSMNIGLSHAKGEYVGILESDDFGDDNMFESLYSYAKKYDADVVKSEFYYHRTGDDPSKDEIAGNMAGCYCGSPFQPLDHQEMFLMQPAIWSGLYRRSFLEENAIRFLRTPGASFQDTSFNFKVFAMAKRAYLTHDAFLHYRIDNANSSVKSQAKVFCICDEYKEMWRFVRQSDELMTALSKRLCFIQFGGYMWNLGRLTPALQPSFYERVVEDFSALDKEGLLEEEYFDEPSWRKLTEMLADSPSFFAQYFGPSEVETTYLLYAPQMGSRPIERSVNEILSAIGPNDELLFVSNYCDSKQEADYSSLREKDARFFYSEILKCTTMTELDLSRIRGDRLVLIGIEKTPAAGEFDEITKAIAQKSEWQGRCGRVRRFDIADGEIGPLPSLLPLMLHWDESDIDVSLGVSESCRCSTMEDYHRAIDVVERCFSWCSTLAQTQGYSSALTAYKKVLIPLWDRLKNQHEGFCYNDRMKLVGKDPDTLSSGFALEECRNSAVADGNGTPQVSVVIPIYNAEQYAKECLDSVFAQKNISFEVICVNDGSTDSSLELLDAYRSSHSNLRVVSKVNGGAASARNVGMSIACGEYVAFIDPDDFFPSEYTLSHLHDAAVANGACVCGGSFSCLNPDGSLEAKFDLESSAYEVKQEGYRSFEDDAFDYGWIRFIYKRSFLVEHEIKFPSLRWYEDPVFFVDVMSCVGQYYLIPEVVYCYRVDYKEPDWTARKTRDILKGIAHNIAFAEERRMGLLYTRLVNRVEGDYLAAIEQNLDDEEVMLELTKMQSSLDPSLISFDKENGNAVHFLTPLKTLMEGGRPTAVVRLAKKAESSRFYKSVQHVREKFN